MIHLFIDTNVFLSFYHLTNDDLEELKKLAVLVEQKAITLYLTDQVISEFRRNREGKIADAVKRLKEQSLNLQYPQMCKDYAEYQQLRALQKQYDAGHAALLAKLMSDVTQSKLKADLTINDLFAASTVLKTSPEIVEQARLRVDVGEPPGKNGSLGDAINWALLLAYVPVEQDLHFVSDDKDYASTLDGSKFKDFLNAEWFGVNASAINFYKRLSSFLKNEFPTIHLASDVEKDLLIKQLVASPNFATTHSVIAKLAAINEFNDAQAGAVLAAATANNQVGWIATDADVEEFLKSVLEVHKDKLEPTLVAEVESLLNPPVPVGSDDDADHPF